MKLQLPSFLKRTSEPVPEFLKEPDHVHEWEIVAKTFVEPKPINIPESMELTQLCLTGMTTYLFQCAECHDFRKEEVSGIETTTLDKLIEKVQISGPEYVMKDGKTFIVMQYQKPEQTIPIR